MSHDVLAALKKAQSLISTGKFKKAELLCKNVLKQAPCLPDAFHLLGYSALQQKNYRQVVDAYKKAIQYRANDANYHYNIGLAHLNLLQYDDAITYLQTALTLNPGGSVAYCDLCLALTKVGRFEPAIKTGKKAVELNPDNAAAHNNLALAYDGYQNYDASFEHYKKAAELSPNKASLQLDLGNVYVGRGDIDAARENFRKVIELEPDQVAVYGNLVRITKYTSPENDDAIHLQSLLAKTRLSDDERTVVFFALGKIYQDCQLYDEAFGYFQKGNKLQDIKNGFDPVIATQAVSSIVEHCSSDLLSQKQSIGHNSQSPVFVIGTPRSGTTLTEQILSSHPDAFGAGELAWVGDAANNLQSFLKSSSEYPKCMSNLTEQSIGELASKYLRYTKSLANGELKIIDKMPGNFIHLGLINCLFPNAKIIHCRREPKDACVSMYCNYFPDTVTYSYDLYKLGAYYSQYNRVMRYWHNILPSSRIISVDYENLVRNQEQESRRLIKFIGLDWHDDCLEFYNKRRRVNTASDMQVTKPMYTSSISRWKRYEKHLQPLEDGFNYQNDTE